MKESRLYKLTKKKEVAPVTLVGLGQQPLGNGAERSNVEEQNGYPQDRRTRPSLVVDER